MPRQPDCINYRACLDLAALADADAFTCPCDRFQHDPHAAPWADVQGCQHLVMAILRPDAYEVFRTLLSTPESGLKWRVLRSAWPSLGLRKRDMG
jgi:hypothetical protein